MQGLELEAHLRIEIGAAQALLDEGRALHPALVLFAESDGAAAMVLLGEVERKIGAFVEAARRVAGVWESREADGSGDGGDGVVEGEGLARRLADAGAERQHGVFVAHVFHDQAELVAAQTRHESFTAGHLQDARAAFDENTVADDMAKDVVDRLEAVEIENADIESSAVFGAPDGVLEALEELAAVGQAGQAVDMGDARILVAELLRVDLRGDQSEKVARGADDRESRAEHDDEQAAATHDHRVWRRQRELQRDERHADGGNQQGGDREIDQAVDGRQRRNAEDAGDHPAQRGIAGEIENGDPSGEADRKDGSQTRGADEAAGHRIDVDVDAAAAQPDRHAPEAGEHKHERRDDRRQRIVPRRADRDRGADDHGDGEIENGRLMHVGGVLGARQSSTNLGATMAGAGPVQKTLHPSPRRAIRARAGNHGGSPLNFPLRRRQPRSRCKRHIGRDFR